MKKNKGFIISILCFIYSMFAIGLMTYLYYNVKYIGQMFDLTWTMFVNEFIGGQILWYGGIISFVLGIILLIYDLINKNK